MAFNKKFVKKKTMFFTKDNSTKIGIVVSILAILTYFGIQPFVKADNENKVSSEIKGDVIISNNQSGGITAHTINNYRPKKRDLTKYSKEIIEHLSGMPIAAYRLEYSNIDPEAEDIALQIDTILKQLNWQRFDPIIRLAGTMYKSGITFYTLKDAEPVSTLANLIWQALDNKGVERQVLTGIDNVFRVHGWPPQKILANRQGVVIVVGPSNDE